jgi:hypothetical protein
VTNPRLRASDADRLAAARVVQDGIARGCLGHEEGGERLAAVWASRWRDELPALTADLPPAPPARPPARAAAPAASGDVLPPGRWTPRELRERAAGFLVPNLVCLGVWLASGAHGDFWPRWVLLVTTIALVASFVRGPDAERERRREREARRRPRP